jgi:hypothetical protein
LRLVALVLATVLLLPGCGTFNYALKTPPPKPDFVAVPPALTRPTLRPGDCPRFVMDREWLRESWSPDLDIGALKTTTILAGDPHPAAPMGVADCKHVVVSPGWWVTSKEALIRYPKARAAVMVLESHLVDVGRHWSGESKRLATLGKLATRDQLRMLFLGMGAGAALTAGALLAVLLGTR